LLFARLLEFHVMGDVAQDSFGFVTQLRLGHSRRRRQDRASKRLPLREDGLQVFKDEIR
jgi:hypothetical protein